MHKTLYNISRRGGASALKTLHFLKGAPVFVEGGICAMAQWHMASPSLPAPWFAKNTLFKFWVISLLEIFMDHITNDELAYYELNKLNCTARAGEQSRDRP